MEYVSTRAIGGAAVTIINEGRAYCAPRLTAPEHEWRRAIPEADAAGRIPVDHHVVHVRVAMVEQAGLLELVEGNREVAPGLWMLHAPGESPGHSVARLTSVSACFYALGDLFHLACEVEHRDWSVPCVDREAMRASRDRLLHDAATQSATVVFAHERFPPWGRILETGAGYRWSRG